MHSFFRCMICLLLICAFMINLLPTRAEAFSTGALVAAGTVVASALIGLGLSIGTDAVQHSAIVQQVVSHLDSLGGYISDGLISVTSLGSGRYGIKGGLLQTIFDFLYSSKAITAHDVNIVPNVMANELIRKGSFKDSYYNAYSCWKPTKDCQVIQAYCYNGIVNGYHQFNVFSLFLCTEMFYVYENIGSYNSSTPNIRGIKENGYYYGISSFLLSCNDERLSEARMNLSSFYEIPPVPGHVEARPLMMNLPAVSRDVVSDYDVSINFVANQGASLATGYPAWHANSISIPNAETGEEEEYYPIAIGKTHEETQGFTQEDVWAGNGTYVDSESVPGTGDGTITVPDNVTLKDILTGVVSIPQAISIAATNVIAAVQAIPAAIQAIPAAIADFFSFKPPPDHNQFALVDLKDFFPFCIPFDLYAFFQLLDADPVAPVLSWEIPDLSGQVYSLSIDLAEWDSVALLFRRLQLFLFITGLAAASRKFIKW